MIDEHCTLSKVFAEVYLNASLMSEIVASCKWQTNINKTYHSTSVNKSIHHGEYEFALTSCYADTVGMCFIQRLLFKHSCFVSSELVVKLGEWCMYEYCLAHSAALVETSVPLDKWMPVCGRCNNEYSSLVSTWMSDKCQEFA